MAILLNGWIFPTGQSGEASLWRVCYQWSLPRLVLVNPDPLLSSPSLGAVVTATWDDITLNQ